MRAVVIEGIKNFRIADNYPKPIPSGDELLIKVKATGICGTDLEMVEGHHGYFTSGMARYPVVPGHEWVGEIHAVGENVKGFAVGEHVVGETIIPCWKCSDCHSGSYQRCLNRIETGIMNKNGGFAEYLVYPAKTLHKLSKDVPITSGCLIEPLSVAVNATKRVSLKKNDFVVIFGDGPIGLFLLMVAKAIGARAVVVGGLDNRLEKAKDLGADAIYNVVKNSANASNELQELIKQIGHNELADCVIEATGNPLAIQHVLETVKVGGQILLLGLFGGKRASVDLDKIVLKDITIKGTVGSPNVWPETIALVESGKIDPSKVVSHKFRLPQFGEAVKVVQQKSDNVVKAIIVQD